MKDDFTCKKCGKSLLRLNYGVLEYQWKTYGKYYCYEDRPAEEILKQEERRQARLNAL